jgi:regulatory protein
MGTGLEVITLLRIEKKGRLFLLSFSNGFEIKAAKVTIDGLNLSEGLELAPESFNEIKSVLEGKFAYYTAESLLARRSYSIGEFRDRMRRKGIADYFIRQIISDFQAKNLLDDYRYAAVRVQTLMDHKPAGRSYLIAYLRDRKIPPETAKKVVSEALTRVSEIEIAARLLEKRRASFMKFDVETARRKAYNYLSRRGISYRAAREAFENLFVRPQD